MCGKMENQTHFPLLPPTHKLWYSLYPHCYCQSLTKEAAFTFRNAIFFRRVKWGKDDENYCFLIVYRKGNGDVEPVCGVSRIGGHTRWEVLPVIKVQRQS